MKIIAVVGTGSGCGKTTVVCRILRAIPGLGAVKISPRDGALRVEWGGGEPGKDTDLYVSSGAVPVARIIGPREQATPAWEKIKGRFSGCRGVVIEGASALDFPDERYAVFVVGAVRDRTREARDGHVEANSDVLVTRASPADDLSVVEGIRAFFARSGNS